MGIPHSIVKLSVHQAERPCSGCRPFILALFSSCDVKKPAIQPFADILDLLVLLPITKLGNLVAPNLIIESILL